MGNFNKFDKFPLMECVQKRVIMWNEPNFEPGAEEILKTVFGGDVTNVKTTNYQETTDTPTELSAMDTDADTESFTQDVNNMRKGKLKNCSPESVAQQTTKRLKDSGPSLSKKMQEEIKVPSQTSSK
ncbi:Putative non-capsid protein NS-1 [Eumeta japonica]|uniref:Non-capsid protein NS-1 n=2 Tax=Eumeta variegata TaxID=151549 RepID=A0A4C1YYW3_EUMVA|nr:Putative non-capsid protein NS-1 [Eumeta japonica]